MSKDYGYNMDSKSLTYEKNLLWNHENYAFLSFLFLNTYHVHIPIKDSQMQYFLR